jgi:glycosyltransferase involved in cell wall biosynthesis
MNSPVEILLSTYNGGQYLSTQLDSILQQDYPYWKLLIRDDGSTDGTLSTLQVYAQKYPDKIILLNDTEGNLGYCESFYKLLKQSSADYLMFCDQDDYWYPSKISTMLSYMIREEVGMPVMARIVFSDLEVADSELKTTKASFLKMIQYSSRSKTQVFFLKNYVPGCNIMFNRTLIQQAFKTDNIVHLHDYWLMLVCSAVGKITFIKKPLMKYRMHDNNAIGHKEQQSSFINRLMLFLKEVTKYGAANKKYRDIMYSHNMKQMKNICKCLPTDVSIDAVIFSEVDKSSYLARKIRNISTPYLLETSLLKQLTYIICF